MSFVCWLCNVSISSDNIFINGSTGDIRIGDLGLSTKMAEGRDLPTEKNTPLQEPREVRLTCIGVPRGQLLFYYRYYREFQSLAPG